MATTASQPQHLVYYCTAGPQELAAPLADPNAGFPRCSDDAFVWAPFDDTEANSTMVQTEAHMGMPVLGSQMLSGHAVDESSCLQHGGSDVDIHMHRSQWETIVPPQPVWLEQSSPPSVQRRASTASSKAFKIVNPRTKEEINTFELHTLTQNGGDSGDPCSVASDVHQQKMQPLRPGAVPAYPLEPSHVMMLPGAKGGLSPESDLSSTAPEGAKRKGLLNKKFKKPSGKTEEGGSGARCGPMAPLLPEYIISTMPMRMEGGRRMRKWPSCISTLNLEPRRPTRLLEADDLLAVLAPGHPAAHRAHAQDEEFPGPQQGHVEQAPNLEAQPLPEVEPVTPTAQVPAPPPYTPPRIPEPLRGLSEEVPASPLYTPRISEPARAPATVETKKGIRLKNAPVARSRPKEAKHEVLAVGDAVLESERDHGSQRNVADKVAASDEERKVESPFLKPLEDVIDRRLMLRIWRAHQSELNPLVYGLPVASKASKTSRSGRRRPATESVMQHSANPYTSRTAVTRKEDIERSVRRELNKVCPDNLQTIVEHLAGIDLQTAEELELVISIIVSKALAERHYCETYADVVFKLQARYPEFPPAYPGGKPTSFTRLLLNNVQREFEGLPKFLESMRKQEARGTAEETELEMHTRKVQSLANMKLIGNLFLRRLLSVKVISQVLHELICDEDSLHHFPHEFMLECVCELLEASGHTLEEEVQGNVLLSHVSARLLDLKCATLPGGKELYSKRVQFLIQNLLELRANGWEKKMLKEQAKVKADIQRDQAQDAHLQTKGAKDTFATQIAGLRPSYIKVLRTQAPAKQQKPYFDSVKKPLDQGYVKQLARYFWDDRNVAQLANDWSRASPTPQESKQGVVWLLEDGFQDLRKQEDISETIFQLVARMAVTWDVFGEALAPFWGMLEGLQIDYPCADKLFHALLSRFLLAGSEHDAMQTAVWMPLYGLADQDAGASSVWALLSGVFGKVEEKGGKEAVRRVLDVGDLAILACRARRCSRKELEEHLNIAGAH